MERPKEYQDLIDRLPETGTKLIDWHKWLIRNHFRLISPIEIEKETDTLKIAYCRDNKGKLKKKIDHYSLYIIIKSNTSVYYLRNKLKDYLKYEKKYKTAPTIFKEYDKNIEEKNIRYFTIEIWPDSSYPLSINLY